MDEMNPVVFIVDDDDGIRRSLSMLIESIGLHVRAYASPREFFDSFDQSVVGCLVLDMRMPQMSGHTLHKMLNEKGWNIPVIFITGHGDVPMAVTAMKEGAIDFLEKPLRQQSLIDAIQTAIDKHIKVRSIQMQTKKVESRLARLTEREIEIKDLIIRGMPNKVIARRLGLSTRTVEVHRANIFEKVQVTSLAELIRLFSTSSVDVEMMEEIEFYEPEDAKSN